jgi:hypothetical protein
MHSLSYFLTNLHAYDFEIWFQQINFYHVVCDEQSLKRKPRNLLPFRDIYTDASRQKQTNFSQTIETILEKIIYEQMLTFLDYDKIISNQPSDVRPGQTSLLQSVNQWLLNIDKGI